MEQHLSKHRLVKDFSPHNPLSIVVVGGEFGRGDRRGGGGAGRGARRFYWFNWGATGGRVLCAKRPPPRPPPAKTSTDGEETRKESVPLTVCNPFLFPPKNKGLNRYVFRPFSYPQGKPTRGIR